MEDVTARYSASGARKRPLRDHQGAAHSASKVGKMRDSRESAGDSQKELDTRVDSGKQPRRHRYGRNQGNDFALRKQIGIRQEKAEHSARGTDDIVRWRGGKSRDG